MKFKLFSKPVARPSVAGVMGTTVGEARKSMDKLREENANDAQARAAEIDAQIAETRAETDRLIAEKERAIAELQAASDARVAELEAERAGFEGEAREAQEWLDVLNRMPKTGEKPDDSGDAKDA